MRSLLQTVRCHVKSKILRDRADCIAKYLLTFIPKGKPVIGLDVGCGNGEVARYLMERYPHISLEGVEVLVRPKTYIRVRSFDGQTLPFNDNSFDFVMLVDVLHHTDCPDKLVAECKRVAREFLIIKDHLCNSPWDDLRLRVMDWSGNFGTEVALPYNFLSSQQWQQLYQQVDIIPKITVEKLNLYPWLLRWLLDRNVQFISCLDTNQ